MVRPPPKHPVDVDLVSFINDFLFDSHHDDPSSPSVLRRQRTPPRYKRYRSMWRAAATSLIAKRSASQETHLPFEGRPPSNVSLHNGHFPLVDTLPRELPSRLSLDHGTGDSQEHIQNNDITIDVDAAPLLATTRGSHKDQPHEAVCTRVISKHSAKKPPRPPKTAGISRSGSYRVIRLKTATRRVMVDTTRMKKQKMPKSTSNATFIWALIITICFVSIMLVQGFFGDNSKGPLSAVEGQGRGEAVSLSPSKMGRILSKY